MEYGEHCGSPISSYIKVYNYEHSDQRKCRSKIDSVLYIIASRSDAIFSVCLCARHEPCLNLMLKQSNAYFNV